MRYVIVGNSAAGLSAAKAIRTIDRSGDITVVSEEQGWGYSRIFLPDLIKNRITESQLFSHGPDWYRMRKIVLRDDCKIIKVDRQSRFAQTASGEKLYYDRLLIATGSQAEQPNLAGIRLSGVFPLRTILDARKIKEFAERSKTAVVLGGGLVGLKTAEALSTIGLKVTVGVSSDRILSRQLDRQGASLVQDVFQKAGVIIKTDCSPECIESDDSGRVSGVDFGEKGRVSADLVILAKGVRPQLDLARQCGLHTGQGICTNEFMEAAIPEIYAAGDVAETHAPLSGKNEVLSIWPVAVEQGRIAGLNMAGLHVRYQGLPSMNIVQLYHVNIVSVGSLLAEPGDTIIRSTSEGNYRLVIMRQGKLAGALEVGTLSEVGPLSWLLRRRVDLSTTEIDRLHHGFSSLNWVYRNLRRGSVKEKIGD